MSINQPLIIILTLLLLGGTRGVQAQSAGTIIGTVRSSTTGAPLAGVNISIGGSSHLRITDHQGHYEIDGLTPGEWTVHAERIGIAPVRETVTLAPGMTLRVDFEVTELALGLRDIVISVDREARRLVETPATINVLSADDIHRSRATHPAELMAQVPGAWVNSTSGEGHMTAIRQPQTTSPVYLYLEDGVPTRSTGFFNHNALYEINLPQAGRIEVVKGPATALYGSDAIGATIDIGTRDPTREPTLDLTLEGGAHRWGRILLSKSGWYGGNGIRADLNLTRTDGWREGTAYDRYSGTLRWDREIGAATSLKTIATISLIDQYTAGSSALSRTDYQDHPRSNYTPISYREVRALRFSSELSHLRPRSLLTITAFARDNQMEMIPNWSLTYDPSRYLNGHRSLGLMVKYRHDIPPLGTRIIAGLDLDRSPGDHFEEVIIPARSGQVFTEYEVGETIYDYDVLFLGLSPYLQLETAPLPGLHLSAGLRYDELSYTYESRLTPIDTGRHRRPPAARVSYHHLSPKLGAAFEIIPELNLFASYGDGFRAPSEGQLFRQGQARNTLELRPVRVDSYEGGIRGAFGGRLRYELSIYQMTKLDDILSHTHPDGSVETVNAGRTLHRGIEIGTGVALPLALDLDLAYTWAEHRYQEWTPGEGIDLGGRSIEQAPREIGSATLTFAPRPSGGPMVALETRWIGRYWMDPENTTEYSGHTLTTLRAESPLYQGLNLFVRITNLTDTRYAELATHTIARGQELAPGMPRALYIGLTYQIGER